MVVRAPLVPGCRVGSKLRIIVVDRFAVDATAAGLRELVSRLRRAHATEVAIERSDGLVVDPARRGLSSTGFSGEFELQRGGCRGSVAGLVLDRRE